MKFLILVLLVSIIVFSQCDSNLPIIGKKEKESMSSKVTLMCYFVRLLGGPSGYKVVDNNDGTVALVSYSSLGADFCPPPFGKTESINVKYYIKKCIQGQVYRQAQNDCKGTGTAANYYGAQKLQMCPTTSTCIDSDSPAMISCINDTTAGKAWKPGGFESGANIKIVSNFLKSRQDEIPATSTDYYWSQILGATLANIDGSSAPTGSSIINFGYVLCFQNKS